MNALIFVLYSFVPALAHVHLVPGEITFVRKQKMCAVFCSLLIMPADLISLLYSQMMRRPTERCTARLQRGQKKGEQAPPWLLKFAGFRNFFSCFQKSRQRRTSRSDSTLTRPQKWGIDLGGKAQCFAHVGPLIRHIARPPTTQL